MISTKGRYALRAMIDIAKFEKNGYVSIKDISEREGISIKYLEQVISILVRTGFLISLRGNNGGYKLAKKAKEYKVGDILRAAEGSLAPVSCLSNPINECPRKSSCATLDFWTGLNNTINNYVDSYTLEDLVNKYVTEGGEYYI